MWAQPGTTPVAEAHCDFNCKICFDFEKKKWDIRLTCGVLRHMWRHLILSILINLRFAVRQTFLTPWVLGSAENKQIKTRPGKRFYGSRFAKITWHPTVRGSPNFLDTLGSRVSREQTDKDKTRYTVLRFAVRQNYLTPNGSRFAKFTFITEG